MKSKNKDKDKSAAKKKPKDVTPPDALVEGQTDWFDTINRAKEFFKQVTKMGKDWGIKHREEAGAIAKDLAGLLGEIEQDNMGGGEYPKTDEFSPGQKTNVEMGTIDEKKIKNLKEAALQQNKALVDFNNKILSAMKIL